MGELGLDQDMRSSFARKSKRLIAAALLSTILTACGGGDDSPTAAAPSTATPAAATPGATAPPGAAAPSGATAPPTTESSAGSGGLAVIASAKGSTTLSWQPPTRNDDGTPVTLTGYRIYWGLSEGHYPNSVTLSNPGLTRHVVEQLPPNTYYFVATALSAQGESEPSNVIVMKVL